MTSQVSMNIEAENPLNLTYRHGEILILRVRLSFWMRLKILFGAPVLATFKNMENVKFTVNFDV